MIRFFFFFVKTIQFSINITDNAKLYTVAYELKELKT